MLGEHARVEAHHFLCGKRVEHSADAVHFARDVLRAAPPRPLNTMCSMKCEMPFSSAGSRRDPVRSQTPTETEWKYSIGSVITTSPFGRISFCNSIVSLVMCAAILACAGGKCHCAYISQC